MHVTYVSFADFTGFELTLKNATSAIVHKNNLNTVHLLLDYLHYVLRDCSVDYIGFNLN